MSIPEEILNNIFNSWKNCKNNQTIIENVSNIKYIFNSDNGDNTEKCTKKTLLIDKCSNLDIKINEKYNHILILNSNNIILKLDSGLISGLTMINTKNITVQLKNNNINYSEISNSDNCIFVYDKLSSNDSYINTFYSYNLNFIIQDEYIFKKFITNQSLFSINEKYYIYNDELKKLN